LEAIDERSIPKIMQLWEEIQPVYCGIFARTVANRDPYFALYTIFWRSALSYIVRRYLSYPSSRQRLLEIVDDSGHLDEFLELFR